MWMLGIGLDIECMRLERKDLPRFAAVPWNLASSCAHRDNAVVMSIMQVVSTFGPSSVAANGEIDRRKLGEWVFSSPLLMKKLTDIVWPEMKKLGTLMTPGALELPT